MAELEELIRQIAREEATRVYVEQHRARGGKDGMQMGVDIGNQRLEAAQQTGLICGAVDAKNFVCLKAPHKGRHLFRVRPHVAPERPWEPITEATIQSGTRNYVITVNHPVKVQGLGRGGAAGDGYKVVSMERHTETGKINVEVLKVGRGQRSRTVPLDRIVYKRPPRS